MAYSLGFALDFLLFGCGLLCNHLRRRFFHVILLPFEELHDLRQLLHAFLVECKWLVARLTRSYLHEAGFIGFGRCQQTHLVKILGVTEHLANLSVLNVRVGLRDQLGYCVSGEMPDEDLAEFVIDLLEWIC